VEVGGLVGDEVTAYADKILAPHPDAQPKRQTKVFGELLRWLDGHPLSMRLILPHLDTTTAQALLDALRGVTPLLGDDGGGRLTSLPASITYSFIHLPANIADALVAVSLFHQVADADVAAWMTTLEDCPARFAGPPGETFEDARERWAGILDAAAAVGLLTDLGSSIYRIHPALPGYLAARWNASADGYQVERNAAERTLLAAFAKLSRWALIQIGSGDAGLAFDVIDQHRANLYDNLGHALHRRDYDRALAIAQPLNTFWDARGLAAEADGWVNRVREAVETADGQPPPLDSDARQLWVFMVDAHAGRQREAGLFDQAEHTHRAILDSLATQPQTREIRGHIAAATHQLGTVASDRGRLDEAEQWYRKSLTIYEELQDRPAMSTCYHQLGMVAHLRGRLDEAEQWYRKSLTIEQEVPHRPGTSTTYGQLGILAADRGRLDEAERWFRKELTIEEELRNRPGMAATYHQLGNIAYLRGRLDEADRLYHKTLTIREELQNPSGLALIYGQLGLLAEARGNPGEALKWTARCIALFPGEFPSSSTAHAAKQLRRLTRNLGVAALEQAWQNITHADLPARIRAFVEVED
jgi:tetratricopeptide (TPR) repeat protein